MKKILFILTLAALAIACHDDEVTPLNKNADAQVTRISRSGITVMELFYDVDKKLYRINDYYLGKLLSYTVYDYEKDGLKELRRYHADDHSFDYRIVFTRDNLQRVIKGEHYPSGSSDQVATLLTFEYDGEGLLKTKNFILYGELNHQDEYTYDDKGNEITEVRTYNPNQSNEYRLQYDYTPGNKTMPAPWKEYVFIMAITGSDDRLTNMFISNARYRNWNSADELLTETTTEVSGQEYDDAGNLIRQIMTRKDITNPENPDIVDDMSYDFQQQD